MNGRLLLHYLLPVVRRSIQVCSRPLSYAAAPRPRFAGFAGARRRGMIMANVTRANFEECREQLQGHLKTADFVALDFEMTGVETTPWRRYSEMDTPEVRYLHVKNSAESFAVWQCGVCPFRWDDDEGKFVAYPYNFFVFPRNELPVDMPSKSYFCQTSSLEFLAKHHFDFNATVYSGISYLSLEQGEIARAKLGLTEEGPKRKSTWGASESEIPLNRTADVVFTEKIRVEVGQWRDSLLRDSIQLQSTSEGVDRKVATSEDATQRSETPSRVGESPWPAPGDASAANGANVGNTAFSHSRPAYFLDIFGNNQARLVKQLLRKNYQDLVPILTRKPNNEEVKQMRIIFTSSKEDKANLEKELEEEEARSLEVTLSNAIGFRKVIDAIKAAGKPLVGHNCLLDMAHLHDKFLGPLPSSMKKFSASLRRHFPCVLDTKYLLKTESSLRDAYKSTSLAIAYQELCQGFPDRSKVPGKFYNGKPKIVDRPMSRVKVEVSSDFQRYPGGGETGLKHEAGFDAYMTGSVFAQICHILRVGVQTIRSLGNITSSESTGFASYANLLMLQTFRGQSALDLTTGSEVVGLKAPRGPVMSLYRSRERENVALVWGTFPPQGQEAYLRKLVQKVFSKDKRLVQVDIHIVDRSACFVEFRVPSNLEAFFSYLERVGEDAMTSSKAVSDDELPPLKAARFKAYEKLCGSPLALPTLGMAADLLGGDQLRAVDLVTAIGHTNVKPSVAQDLSKASSLGKSKAEDTFTVFEVGPWAEEGSTSVTGLDGLPDRSSDPKQSTPDHENSGGIGNVEKMSEGQSKRSTRPTWDDPELLAATSSVSAKKPRIHRMQDDENL